MITLHEFKRLSMEQKNEEILRKVVLSNVQFAESYNFYMIFTTLVVSGQGEKWSKFCFMLGVKTNAVRRNLPLLFQLNEDLRTVRGALSTALDNISSLEAGAGTGEGAGRTCSKTRSVDQILGQHNTHSGSHFHSVDNIDVSGHLSNVSNVSNVSSMSTGPLPDISGEVRGGGKYPGI